MYRRDFSGFKNQTNDESGRLEWRKKIISYTRLYWAIQKEPLKKSNDKCCKVTGLCIVEKSHKFTKNIYFRHINSAIDFIIDVK